MYTRACLIWMTLAVVACRPTSPAGGTDTHAAGDGGVDTSASDDTGSPVDPGAVSLRLLPAGQLNHLLPVRVAVDSTRRVAWSVGNGLPTTARVDLAAGALLDVFDLGDVRPNNLHVAVDGAGVPWFLQDGAPLLTRLDPDTGELLSIDPGPTRSVASAGLPDGGVAFAATMDGGDQVLSRTASGEEGPAWVAGGSVMGLALGGDGLLWALVPLDGDVVVVRLDPETLHEVDRCTRNGGDAPGRGISEMSPMGADAMVVTQDQTISVVRCDGADWHTIQVGLENRSAVWNDGLLTVLDRVGDTAVGNPNYGVARRFDATLESAADPFLTGKNSGTGGLDPETGLFWFNSEGTSELIGADPEAGTLAARAVIGQHVESVVGHADYPGVVWVTGRLGGTLARVDLVSGDRVDVAADVVAWPISPVFVGDVLWVLDHVNSTLVGVSIDDLSLVHLVPLGLPENGLLTLDDLAYDADRHTLFVSHSMSGNVVAVDPDAGIVRSTWALPLRPVTNPDTPGRLEIVAGPAGVVVVRNHDGEMARIDPETGQATHYEQADAAVMSALANSRRMDKVALSADGAHVYVAGRAYSADSLVRASAKDLGVDAVIGWNADGSGMGWQAAPPALIRISADGVASQLAALDADENGEPGFDLVEGVDRSWVWAGSFSTATLSRHPL